MSRRKGFIFMCFGIAVGLSIGTAIKNYRTIENVKQCRIDKPVFVKNSFSVIGMPPDNTILNSQKNLAFIGVMTAKNFLNGRAKAVYDTWGKEIPGHIAFFSSEGSTSSSLPVIALKNVDDRYPPQKKSFMMLYYMYEHFIDKFEWFIRADDDVYIDADKLEKFLRSIDSAKPQFIGQAGKGNSEEFGLLSLEFDENFCMGGPGVILSRETLRRVAPHIPTCLKNLYSTHEDVEVGRCVQKFAGIPCTWNYEMQYILRHNSSGKNAFTGNLKRKEMHNAISLHPVKQGPLMYRLYSYMQGLKAEELRQESLLLHRDIALMVKYLYKTPKDRYITPGVLLYSDSENKEHFEDHNVLGFNPDLNKFRPSLSSDLLDWTFIARSLYSADQSNPKRKIDSATKEGLEDAITEVMEYINNFSRQRGRIIEFRELLYGYSRLNTLHGQDLILDLLLIYKKYRGKKMTVPVRRHIYVQRSFTGIFVKEFNEDFFNLTLQKELNNDEMATKMKKIFNMGFEKLSKALPGFNSDQVSLINKKNIVFVLPISARIETFKRFLQNYEDVAIKNDDYTDLLIVLFGSNADTQEHLEYITVLSQRYSQEKINVIYRNENFSRGIALDIASRSSYIQESDIIFFIDVDIMFNQISLDRIRMNTIQGKQVYLPIVFSEYDSSRILKRPTEKIHDDNGYFRQFGYGICSIYKSDINDPEINGFDKDIVGWGLEDVKFLEKIIKIGKRRKTFLVNTSETNLNYNITKEIQLKCHRSPDPSLIHVYHEINCDEHLDGAQYNMCLGTKANTIGSTKLMENIFLSNQKNIDFILELNNKDK